MAVPITYPRKGRTLQEEEQQPPKAKAAKNSPPATPAQPLPAAGTATAQPATQPAQAAGTPAPAPAKEDEKKNKKPWSGLFQAGAFIVISMALMMLKSKDVSKWYTNWPFLLTPQYIVFALGCGAAILYSAAIGKSRLGLINFVLWVFIIGAVISMFAKPGQIQAAANYPLAQNNSSQPAASNYQPPLGYVKGETSFSLAAGETKLVHFRPGMKTEMSVDTKRERCGNDSMLIVGGEDTIKTWLPEQHFSTVHDEVMLVALAPMHDIKLTLW
jgi:hypothetical protein